MAVRLVYETHSTTTDNEAGVCTGWAPGELSATGVRNAEELGARRRDEVDLVVSSDLHRAVQTVDVAFAGTRIPRRTDRRLREVDFGDLTGAPVDVVHAQRRTHVERPFPGGQSYRQVVDGVRELLGELVRDHDGERVLLVGHAATRYALDHLLTGRPLARAASAPFAWREGWEYVVEDRVVGVQLPAHTERDGFRCSVVPRGRTAARVLLRLHRPGRAVVDRPGDRPGAGGAGPRVGGRAPRGGRAGRRAGRPGPRVRRRCWELLHEEVLPDRDLWGVRIDT